MVLSPPPKKKKQTTVRSPPTEWIAIVLAVSLSPGAAAADGSLL